MSGPGAAIRTFLRGTGQLLITFGLVVLLFCVYELSFTGFYTAKQQTRLQKQFSAPQPVVAGKPVRTVPPIGDALAQIYLPRFGRGYHFIVVEGVGTEALKDGPGHYPGTALPGGLGNTVISGHRTTYKAPFNRLDEVKAGDLVVLETRTSWFTYRVTGQQVVQPSAIEVTYPVPGKRGEVPKERLLTLTTCNPKYSASTRLILRGTLVESLPKGPGIRPAALD